MSVIPAAPVCGPLLPHPGGRPWRDGGAVFNCSGALTGLPYHGFKGVDKMVNGLFVFTFRWFDHDGAMHHQWKIDGGGMKSIIDETLGHIQGGRAGVHLIFIGEDTLVHAGSVIGKMEIIPQTFLDVVGIEHRIFADMGEPFCPHGTDVGIGPDNDTEVPVKGEHATDGVRCLVDQVISPVGFFHPGHRQEGFQVFDHSDGAGAGSAAAMGGGKGLVQVEVDDVNAQICRFNNTLDGVHVGTIPIHQSAFGMDDVGDFPQILLKKTQGVGVGNHDAGGLFIHHGGHGFRGEDAVGAGLNVYGFYTRRGPQKPGWCRGPYQE